MKKIPPHSKSFAKVRIDQGGIIVNGERREEGEEVVMVMGNHLDTLTREGFATIIETLTPKEVLEDDEDG